MSTRLSVLILEDRPADAELMVYELRRAGFTPQWRRVETEPEFLACLDPALDLILADYSLPHFDAVRALQLLRARELDIPFIIVSGSIGEDFAVAAMQQGATDYLLKDRLARLGSAVAQALEQRQLRAEKLRADQRLRDSEQRFRALIEHSSDAVVLVSADAIIHYISPSTTRILGYADEEVVGRDAFELIHPDDQDPMLARLAEVLQTPRKLVTEQFRARHKDGSWRWLEGVGTNLLAEPSVGAIIVNFRDISERKQGEEALRAAEAKYRTLVEHVPAITYIAALDEASSTLYISPQVETILGFSQAEWMADPRRWLKQLHPRDLDQVLADVAHTHASATPIQSEFRILARDGRVVWFRDEAVVVRNEAGQPLFLQGVMIDITQRKQAEEALRESEELYRLITENTGDLISLLDRQGRTVYASPSFRHVLGYDPAELISTSGFDLVHPDDLPGVLEAWGELTTQGTVEATLRYRHADGSWRWIETRDTAVMRQRNFYIVAVGRDVTERKRMEEALREAEARYRMLVEHMPAITYLAEFGAAGAWRYVSPQIESLLGFAPAEWLADPERWYKQMHPDDRERVLETEARSRASGEPFRSEYRLLTRDSRLVWVRDEARVVRDGTDQPLFLQGVMLDITERKHLEAQFLQAQKMESVGQLAGGVAHDFNNLLTAINGYAQLVQEALPPDAAVHGDLEEIVKAGKRAANLTRQLLTFARKQIMEPRVLNLNDLIDDVDKLLRRLLGEDIELITRPASDLGRVRADPGQIEQVLVNLAVNARDAMPGGGKLTIETRNIVLDQYYAQQHVGVTPGPYVLLAVSDTGVGMDAEAQRRIFEPFFTTKEPGRGTGLGLATCYGIVKQHGGNIWVYSEPQHGTTFKVYLPLVEAPAHIWPRHDDVSDLPRGIETVLLAEDEAAVRALAARVLRDQGYTVLEAADGDAALSLVYEHPSAAIDLLLTDVVMPYMSGKALVERLTHMYPGLKALFISGYADDAIVHHGRLDPGVAFLHKPFSPGALARKVREVLDSPG